MTELLKLKDSELAAQLSGFKNYYLEINGIELHYVAGGEGEPLILLPGWPETWWSYHKIMPALVKKYKVLAIDLRGMGSSGKPIDGYDKKTMASDIFELCKNLGFKTVNIAGHDIGAMVAFSFAANYPEFTAKLIMIDALHPEESMYSLTLLPSYGSFGQSEKINPYAPYLWWFAFHQVRGLPEQLLIDRVHLEHNWFFNHLLTENTSISEFDRSVYNLAYNSFDGIRAGNAWYQQYGQDIEDYKSYPEIATPVLGLGGSSFGWMNAVLPSKAANLKMISIPNCGHFPFEEQPDYCIEEIIKFIG